ncbi:Endonuclease I [Lentibacillus persicus]|uniref:Endonuclease I n=1 Tax=Lentibacillus persicus TaxID=640948 RepID=A0A1I1S6A7_9BACI|nr:endonuclease [Lentibacillus persicus]SFD41882.1 Endonuclease I [Lentibacillus persicus]
MRLFTDKKVVTPKSPQHLAIILSQLRKTQENIQKDKREYYDEEADKRKIEQYYKNIDFGNVSDSELARTLKKLLRDTHMNKVSYDPSEYVYPWVDLRPDGNLASIYSGKRRKVEEVIKEDYAISIKRKEELEKITDKDRYLIDDRLAHIENNFKFNCEHSVPQSWFSRQEPMRGDLHHLFTCEPVCNSIRSNYPYHDFKGYKPEEISSKRIEETCGKADEGLFEPESGKGAVARAMLYFLIRYPDEIESSYRKGIDTALLLDWHQNFPPDLYEKHRNLAIYEIQGNRNPFIDYPKEMMKCF